MTHADQDTMPGEGRVTGVIPAAPRPRVLSTTDKRDAALAIPCTYHKVQPGDPCSLDQGPGFVTATAGFRDDDIIDGACLYRRGVALKDI